MCYVYILQSPKTKPIYIGFTKDLKRRVSEHKQLQRHKEWRLIYYEAYRAREDAVRREQQLKQYGSAKQGLLKRLEESLKESNSIQGLE